MNYKKWIYYYEKNSIEFCTNLLTKHLKFYNKKKYDNILFLCLGTDTMIGDSIGPLVGSLLQDLKNENIHVIGNLESPITGNNYNKTVRMIKRKYKKSLIILIDAAVQKHEIGEKKKEKAQGAISIKKNLVKFNDGRMEINADVNILGFVGSCIGRFDDTKNELWLSRMSLDMIMKISNVIAESIKNAIKNI